MERPEKVITKSSAVRPELGRRDTESPDMFPLCASAPLWPIIEPLLCRNRSKSDDGNMWFGTETENCTGLKMSGGAEAVQKRCSFAALRRSGTKTGPFPVRYRGGGIRFPEDRGGAEATRRVKLNGAENENRYKNSTETFRNVRAGWLSKGEWIGCASAAATRNQNRSISGPVLGGQFLIFEKGCAGCPEPALTGTVRPTMRAGASSFGSARGLRFSNRQ